MLEKSPKAAPPAIKGTDIVVDLAVPAHRIKPVAAERHLRSLDGIRAVSIAMVLLGHLWGTRGFPKMDFGVGDYAHLGVVVFFVISGFLITSLLFAEHEKTGRVSLKLFYARRALRIFPASYCYITIISILWLTGAFDWGASNLLHAATYTVNYVVSPSWHIGHLWSLSVEEQFYLLWPLVFVVLGPRKGIWVAVAVVLLGPVARSVAWLLFHATPYRDLAMFPVVADSLATGCSLARARSWLEGRGWYLRLFHPVVALALLALILGINRYLGYTVVNVVGSSVINVCVAFSSIVRSTIRVTWWVRSSIGSPLHSWAC